MAGYWRMLYGMLGIEYVSKNDICSHQKHLKFLCCQELLFTDVQNLLRRITERRRQYYLE